MKTEPNLDQPDYDPVAAGDLEPWLRASNWKFFRCAACLTLYAFDKKPDDNWWCASYDCAEATRRVIANEVQL